MEKNLPAFSSFLHIKAPFEIVLLWFWSSCLLILWYWLITITNQGLRCPNQTTICPFLPKIMVTWPSLSIIFVHKVSSLWPIRDTSKPSICAAVNWCICLPNPTCFGTEFYRHSITEGICLIKGIGMLMGEIIPKVWEIESSACNGKAVYP